MNCERKALRDVFASTESEAVQSTFSALVIRQVSDTRIEVSDDGFKAYVDFDLLANDRYRKNVELDITYIFYKLQKRNSDALLFTKGSFMKVDPKSTKEPASVVTLKDLVGKQKKEIITSRLFVKVWEVLDTKNHNGGKRSKKIMVGDTDFTVSLTFWNDDIKHLNKIKSGDVLRLHTFGLDDFDEKSPEQPLNITYRGRRPMTNLFVVPFDQVPPSLQELMSNVLEICIEGTVEQIQDSYEYSSCPGDGNTHCGKSVKQGADTCDKCKVSFHAVTPVDTFIVTLVMFGTDGEIYEFKAFQSSLTSFEQPGSSPEEKLKSMLDKTFRVKAKKSIKTKQDTPTIQEISLLNNDV